MGIYIGQQRLNYLWEKIKTIITNKEKVIAAALNDLNDKKADISSLSPVATSGSYNDLTDKPTIPSKVSQLTNDSGFLTSHQQLKTINNESLIGTGNITIQGGGSGEANVIETIKVNGTALTPDSNKAVDITVPSAVTESTVSGWGFTKNAGTVTGVKMNGTTKNPTSGIVDLGTVLTSFTETDPTVPAWAKAANKPTYTATEVGALPDTTVIPAAPGTLNTTATTAQSTSSSEALSGNITLHKVAKTGTYSDLIGKPTIPAAVTESTVSGWGFTKNTGTYSKPSGGIPPTDLSSAVQTSLGKADTALQSYTETDPVFSASAAAGISSTDISNWNSKTSNVGTITGITMNGASKGTSGVVDLGTVITAHQSLSGKQDVINDLATIRSNASSGAAAATTIAGYGDIVTYNASEFQTKITVSSSSPSGGNNGDIWIVI